MLNSAYILVRFRLRLIDYNMPPENIYKSHTYLIPSLFGDDLVPQNTLEIEFLMEGLQSVQRHPRVLFDNGKGLGLCQQDGNLAVLRQRQLSILYRRWRGSGSGRRRENRWESAFRCITGLRVA